MAGEDEYVRRLREKLENRVKTNEEKTRKENREAEICKAEAPKEWLRLKKWLIQIVEQINKGRYEGLVECEEGDDQEVVKVSCLVGTNRKEVTVNFIPIFNGSISVRGKNTLDFECSVQGNKMVWKRGGDHRICTIEEIGKQILDSVI